MFEKSKTIKDFIQQKDIDNLVFKFKNSNTNFKDKRITDIYKQGIYDTIDFINKDIFNFLLKECIEIYIERLESMKRNLQNC